MIICNRASINSALQKLFLFFWLFFLLLLPSIALGAGAYLVDDGGIADAKNIQVENWYSHSNSGQNIFVTNPAYQIFPKTEFAIQETYNASVAEINTLWPQLKYLCYKSTNILNSTVIGINYSSANQKTYGSYVYNSTTLQLNDFADIHLYLGWQNWRHILRNNKSIDFLNYGIGAELHLRKNLSFIPEIFQGNGAFKRGPGSPEFQFGLRYLAWQNLILDGIYGKNITGAGQNWITFGLTLTF
jgi:hypothetical protein